MISNALFSNLELDKEILTNKCVVVIEEDLADTNFVLQSFIIDFASKPKTGICVLALHHSASHYCVLSRKLGVNLRALIESNLVKFVNFAVLDDNLDSIDIVCLYENLTLHLNSMFESCDRILLIIDNLSDLLSLSFDYTELFSLIQNLRRAQGLTLLVNIQVDTENNPEQIRLSQSLSHVSDHQLRVRPLRTGQSDQVTGELVYAKRLMISSYGWSQPVKYHYLLTDRNIKLFPPGNVGIKL